MYAAIRIRGRAGVNKDVAMTLKYLRLTRVNHLVLLPKNKYIEGMLKKAKDYITWGEIDKETLVELLKKRGRLMGNRPIDAEYLKKINFETFEDLANAILEKKVNYSKLPDIKPIFRLNPPRGGYKNTKRSVKENGDLGYRQKEINKLIKRMMVI
ncbi:MAG: 50S ribosomal protein L30 [Thermoplasmata archaeon]|nr:50S ribosomal protein L30 [Thermoplasmata archaeon]